MTADSIDVADISTQKTVQLDNVVMDVAWDNSTNTTALTNTYFNNLHLTTTGGVCKAWVYYGTSYTLETHTYLRR